MRFRDRAFAVRAQERSDAAAWKETQLANEADWAKREAARKFGEEPTEAVVLPEDERARFNGFVRFDDVRLFWKKEYDEYLFWVELEKCPHCFGTRYAHVASLAAIADALESDPYTTNCDCEDRLSQANASESVTFAKKSWQAKLIDAVESAIWEAMPHSE